MSDEDQSSLGEDFSASEDEWKPGQSDSDFEDDNPSFRKGENRTHLSSSSKSDGNSKRTKKRKTTGTSLRTKLFNKYKPPPKTVRNMSTPSKPVEKVRDAVQSNKRISRASKQHNSSDSDSSGDDYLVNPNELDLQSSFFDVKPSTSSASAQNDAPPHFDCNAGMQLTDSEEYDDDDDDSESIKYVGKQNSSKSEKTKDVDLSYLQDFANNMENAKIQYNKQKDRSQLSADTKVDVSSLLAMGEGSATSTAPIKKTKNPKRQPKKTRSTQAAAETDSDWEEVEGEGDVEQTSQITEALANGIQVCIDLPQKQRKDKKAVDVEASLKRHLNRLIKENQVWLHKVSLLCHIYHGLFLNKTINNIELMPMALKLLPSNNVYPSGQTEIKYFQSMITWFKTVMKIEDDCIYPRFKIDPVTSLALQLKNRKAFCKRDYILMFIILLRAMGMQCRLVINMVPMPLRPNPSSLCSLKVKPAAEEGDEKKVPKKEVKSVKKEKVQSKKVAIKSPPLSQEESDELRKKVQALETEIQKKKRQQLKAKRSFEEELEETASTSLKATKSIKKSETKTMNTKEENSELKRKSLDKSTKPEKKVKTDPTVSPYFNEAGRAKRSFKKDLEETASTSPKAAKSIKKSEPKTMDTKEESSKLKRTSLDKSTKPEKKAKTDPTVSPYFNDAGEGKEEKNTVINLASHSKSFDDQQPSVSVNLRKTTKLADNLATTTTHKVTSTATKGKQPKNVKKAVPEIVLVGDEKKNLENITNKSQPKKKPDKRSRSISPKAFISTDFLQTKTSKALHAEAGKSEHKRSRSKSPNPITATIKIKLNQPSPRKLRSKSKLTVPQLDGADEVPKKSRKQNLKKPKMDSDDDFQPSVPKKVREVKRLKKIDRRVLSSDMEEEQSPSKSKKNAINMWVEVYCELEAQWVCVDLFKGKINCVDSIRKSVSPSTLAYVLAYNNDTTVKDVTPRYCTQWATVVRKARVEQTWLDEALREYVTTHRTQRDLTEDMDLRRIHLDKPMPTTISEYKDNPLYALERHLLKFQAIYPPNALTLGFVRGEPVYARECVHTLHSREIWLKSARVVKLGEKPYKIVKARPKWDKFTSSVIKDQPLEIFGYWQTQDYEPPTAENGIVPRNAYGNVELFKECMLPKKTVHLHLPGLNKVCKKLGIDCVPAVIGFDFHQGSCHPLYDGFVVCEEFAEIAADAWDKEQQEAERKEQEKYESRVYGNWKKLIRGLLIREHLKLKYKF